MKSIIYISLILILSTCNTQKNKSDTSTMTEFTGLIQAQGITSYQYGTHTLETKNSFYAIKSETIKLDNHVGETITVLARPIEGYPIDNGPSYLNVISLKK